MRSSRALRALAFAIVCVSSAPDALAAGQAPESATAEAKATAQKKYKEGAAAFTKKRWAQALTAFRASYDVVASPNSHLMIARTLRDSGDVVAAYAELDRVLPEAVAAAARDPKYQTSADAAKAEQAELRTKLALVSVRVVHAPDDARLTVGATPVARDAWDKPIAILPGQAVVVLEAKSGKVQKDVSAPAGGEATVEIELSPPAPVPVAAAPPPPAPVAAPPPAAPPAPVVAKPVAVPPPQAPAEAPPRIAARTSPLRTWAYVSGGAGVAGLATFAVFGAMNQSKFRSLQDACPNGACPAGYADDVDAGKRDQLIANIGLGVGIVGLGVGTGLFLASKPSSASPGAGETARPSVRVGPGSVRIEGRF